VSSEKSLSIEDVAESAASRGGADISAQAMTHAVKLWMKEIDGRMNQSLPNSARRLHRVVQGVCIAIRRQAYPVNNPQIYLGVKGNAIRRSRREKSVAYPQINLGVIHRIRLTALELRIKN
jgi:hypothetical protein